MLKFLKRFIIIVISIVIIIHTLLYVLAHHEENNFLDVTSVEVEASLHGRGDTLDIEYTESKDIQKILKKIKRINFYEDPEDTPFQESPTDQIIISYKDGTKKEITFAGCIVRISTGTFGSDSYRVKTYKVGLIEIERFFRTLPREKELAHYY